MATRTAAGAQGRSFSSRLASPRLSPPPAPPASAAVLRLALAKTGDHAVIHRLLLSVFHGPSAGEFHAQLDEPGYAPADRLVVRDGDEIAAHLRLARLTIQLETRALPAARFMDLATAPEYRSRGLATALLAAGERAAAERGALVGLTRTRAPLLFARLGWSVCGRHVFSTAAPRAVLAELGTMASGAKDDDRLPVSSLLRPQQEPVIVRPLRRIELPAIVRLYEQNLVGQCGWPIRGEAYWEWLLARGACDQIYVAAIAGQETGDLARLLDSIVGYAFVRQCRIVELVTAPGHDDVSRQLLARVCADASEQGGWLVRCDVPLGDPLHDLLRRAGGRLTSSQVHGGELFMAKLLDPLAVLRRLTEMFSLRAREADLPRPVELGLDLRSGGQRTQGVVERFRLRVGPRTTRIETGGPSRHSIALRYGDLAPLVLGSVGADNMRDRGRLKASSGTARRTAAALFPAEAWWRPPLDDLLA